LSLREKWSKFLLPEYPEDFIRQNSAKLQNWWSESRGKKTVSPETIQTLKELSSRGYMLATVSHTSPKYLQEAGVSELFKSAIHAAEFGRRKPHPSIFLAAARECGVSPQECAYVGDRPSRDVVGSREAGIGQVIILNRDDEVVEVEPCAMQADLMIQDISELLNVFPAITKNTKVKRSVSEPTLLYDAALSTMGWARDAETLDEYFTKGRNEGFARFELNHQISPEELESLNLNIFHIGTLHDPCPAVIPAKQLEREDRVITSLDETLRQDGVDVVKHTIEYAYRLGARSVVIHPGRIPGDHSMDDQLRNLYNSGFIETSDYEKLKIALIADRKERSNGHLDAMMKSLGEIIDFAKDTGLSLGLENRFHYYELPVFEEMEIALNEFTQPWVGWQFDVGHLQVHHVLGFTSFRTWLEKFGHRIIGTHLHDVVGIVDHRAPGSGDVDFKLIAAYLPAHAQRTLEVDKSLSLEEIRKGMEILSSAGCVTRI
jgi:HAD superfamily hydrolase (TIGR01509 family)